MFNDRALGVDAPLWNMPELHLWGEVLSYSQTDGLTAGKLSHRKMHLRNVRLYDGGLPFPAHRKKQMSESHIERFHPHDCEELPCALRLVHA